MVIILKKIPTIIQDYVATNFKILLEISYLTYSLPQRCQVVQERPAGKKNAYLLYYHYTLALIPGPLTLGPRVS